jgi:putative endonuclease
MKYSTYILYSQSRDRYYIGYSQNPITRLEEHNSGATVSTRSGRPWQLVYQEDFDNKTQAIKRESEIKRKKSRKYIELLIKTKSVG